MTSVLRRLWRRMRHRMGRGLPTIKGYCVDWPSKTIEVSLSDGDCVLLPLRDLSDDGFLLPAIERFLRDNRVVGA